ncbi:MarR family winged helix-turn-helix transcriptional regulator [Streptomyces sp. NPDC006879]|uniref:MarR family winged helix-turn-helix transcriptional regulator n=1 Tax=Streptomyces sp. NPDC006879 TaxID=3364767 RepID=UPI003698CE33
MPPTSPAVKAQLMELLAHSLGAHYADFATAAAAAGLTSSQAKTLTVLRRSPDSMRSLAGTLGCDASNMTGVIDRLEKRGLVRREVSPADRRVKNVALTEEGIQAIDAIRSTMNGTHAGLDRLSEAEQTELARLLSTVFPR